MRSGRFLGLLMIAASAVGAQPSRRDSAGVHLFTYTAEQLDHVGLKVGSTPAINFTPAANAGETISRITDAFRLPDGRLMVGLSFQSRPVRSELRIYDPSATLRWTFRSDSVVTSGTPTTVSGPFKVVRIIAGDSVLVNASITDHFLVFPMNGGTPRGFLLPSLFVPVEPFADGAFLGEQRIPGPVHRDTLYRGSIELIPLQLVRLSPDHRPTDLLPAFSISELHIGSAPAGAGAPASSKQIAERPVQVRRREGVIGDRFWVFNEERWEVEFHDRNGKLESIVHLPVPAQNQHRPPNSPILADSAFLQGIFSDDAGRLWIEATPIPRPVKPASPDPQVWWVISSDGALVGSAVLPGNLEMYHVAKDYLVAVQANGRAAARVVIYPMAAVH